MNTVDRAIAYAAHAHRRQIRKTTDIPYISHPFAAAMELACAGANKTLIAAAVLHDTIEDTDVTEMDLRGAFGDEITEIVLGCSEPDKSLPWEDRKQHTIHYLATAPLNVQLVSCADKLHNLRCLEDDLAELGDATWARFKRGKEQQAWYYIGVRTSLAGLAESSVGSSMYQELCGIIGRIWS